MSRKVYVEVKVKLILDMEEDGEVGEFINEMDYSFRGNTRGATVLDSEIMDYEVTDSK